jgi:hypothetical protein
MRRRDCYEKCYTQVECAVCGMRKNPIGRSAALEMANSLCHSDCEGYRQEPYPPHFWSKQEFDECEVMDDGL